MRAFTLRGFYRFCDPAFSVSRHAFAHRMPMTAAPSSLTRRRVLTHCSSRAGSQERSRLPLTPRARDGGARTATTGSYARANDVLTTSAAGVDTVYAYCVSGNRMIMTPQTLRQTGELTGTIVFVKPWPNSSLGSCFRPESFGPVCSGAPQTVRKVGAARQVAQRQNRLAQRNASRRPAWTGSRSSLAEVEMQALRAEPIVLLRRGRSALHQ
jgi:hypothetical protein